MKGVPQPGPARAGQIRYRVATAGWSNPPLERQRRPLARSQLEHYATVFDSVEINSSFYRSHLHTTYVRWRASTPPEFRFSVKISRRITHECALRRCRTELREFLREVAGLGRKLDVILVQLPPRLEFDSGVASRFFKALTATRDCHIACEPRHASWFSGQAEALLRRLGIARVAADPSPTPEGQTPAGAARLVYYRLHGSPRTYYSAYGQEFLESLAERMLLARIPTKNVWCVFDNTARHEAWGNARQLRALLSEAARGPASESMARQPTSS